jgi:hypothetical protein
LSPLRSTSPEQDKKQDGENRNKNDNDEVDSGDDNEYDEESSRSETTRRAVIRTTTTARVEEPIRRSRWIRGFGGEMHKSNQPTKEDVHTNREQIDIK